MHFLNIYPEISKLIKKCLFDGYVYVKYTENTLINSKIDKLTNLKIYNATLHQMKWAFQKLEQIEILYKYLLLYTSPTLF